MREAIDAIESGAPVDETLRALEAALLGSGFSKVDYAALADALSLEQIDAPGKAPARLLVAAHIGGTRLIDNMAVRAR